MLETLRQTKELAEKAKEEKERAQKVADDGRLKSGLDAFNKWCIDGNKVDGSNYPIMSKACAVAIVKVLMPKGGPTVKAQQLYNVEKLHQVAWRACWRFNLGGQDDSR